MDVSEKTLKAPFPYFGGKSRVASLVWSRFTDNKWTQEGRDNKTAGVLLCLALKQLYDQELTTCAK